MKRDTYHIPIRIAGLSDGQHAFDETVPTHELELPAEFRQELSVHVIMDKHHSHIVLTVDLTGEAMYPCDRCLEPVRIPVAQHFLLYYARDPGAARMLDEDDVRIVDANAPSIDIAEDVRDYALLAVPMRRTCGENEDGSPVCVAADAAIIGEAGESQEDDAPVDPRWEKLKSLDSGKQP